MNATLQPSLFESRSNPDHASADQARCRMQGMIHRLQAASAPPWNEQIEIILDDGAFRRAMRLVPPEEGDLLWAEFDAQVQRLYAIWQEAEVPA